MRAQLHGRTKSLFSTMKKLLGLGHMTRGGREREEVFDLIGIRAVVHPRPDLPADIAEQAAVQVGQVVELANLVWSGRRKDQCIVTVCGCCSVSASGVTHLVKSICWVMLQPQPFFLRTQGPSE